MFKPCCVASDACVNVIITCIVVYIYNYICINVYLLLFTLIPKSDVWRPLPSLIFGVLGVVSGGLVSLLPETMNHKLPDTIQEAEQFGKTM